MSKLRLFLENFFIYGLGSIISKLVPLVMVPIVTRLMPDSSYFGISDLSNTIVSFGSALAVMGMYDAMYRMFFEKQDPGFQKEICSTTVFFTLTAALVVSAGMLLLRRPLATLVFGGAEYSYLVCLSAAATFVSATNGIVSAPSRMENHRKTFLIMNGVTPVVSYTVAVVLLLKGYYLVALPVAAVLSGLSSELVFLLLNRKWFSIGKVRLAHLKPLLSIALPLLPNVLIYWVFHSCDRLMLASLIGTSATGIYAVSAKLGQVSQLIYTAFANGWQYFAFTTMREKNQVETNSRIFEYLGILSFCAATFMFSLAEPIFVWLFPEEYHAGFLAAPYLFLSPLLLMLYQVIGNQFLVIKKTWPTMLILSGGAVVNVLLNRILIPLLGVEGAAIATLAGYLISVMICCAVLCRMKLMVLTGRFVIASAVMMTFILLWRFVLLHAVLGSLAASILCCGIFVLLYRRDIGYLLKKRPGLR